MRAGRLRHRVTLQSPAQSRDAIGAPVTRWIDVATVWAAVEPLTVRELAIFAQTTALASHKVTIRSYSTLKPDWRITFGDRAFEIEGILDKEERGREMTVLCTELIDVAEATETGTDTESETDTDTETDTETAS